jgi:hypothetical protein
MWLKEAVMEREQLVVTKRVEAWGLVYIIGGTAAEGDVLPTEQADDLVARFDHEQALFGFGMRYTAENKSASVTHITTSCTTCKDKPAKAEQVKMPRLTRNHSIKRALCSMSIFRLLREPIPYMRKFA